MLFMFPLPDDDLTTLFEVFERLDPSHARKFDWSLLPVSVVQLRDPKAVIYLRAIFPDRLDDGSGKDGLDPDDVLIPDHERQECERLLREACPTPHRWFKVVSVAFASRASFEAFRATYHHVLGGEKPCAETPWIMPVSSLPNGTCQTP
jgi:hypothetical protein